MKKTDRVRKIDLSRKRMAWLADKNYNEGDFLSALKFAYRELNEYGGDGDSFARLSDIYEGMNLQGMSINWWFKFLHIAGEEDLPDVYEGLAVNFLTLGMESQSAYYYNLLIDTDDMLPEEAKMDIAEAFSTSKKPRFRFVYPPRLADYSEEVRLGSKALKAGECKRAVAEFSKVEPGSKQYAQAMEMQAVAHLLEGNIDEAERTCKTLLEVEPGDIRALATLAAVYTEQGRGEESKAIALSFSDRDSDNPDELYKMATVCCENNLHDLAYKKFCELDKKTPYDGRILYFKGVSAYKSGRVEEAVGALQDLCTIYPDAEVAKYYLREIKTYREEGGTPPELIYFYHLPQEERERRCGILVHVSEAPKDDAQLFGLLLLHDGFLHWCFDEMDGGDQELQFLGLVTAEHVRADEFIQDVLLDHDVADVIKLETLRLLLERNEDAEFGLVLCNIYRRVELLRVNLGRKRRKKFLEAYAKLAAKFVVIKDGYCERIKTATEALYNALAQYNSLDLVDSVDDCACAIYMMTGLKELGNNPSVIAMALEANEARVKVLLSAASGDQFGIVRAGTANKGEEKDETR